MALGLLQSGLDINFIALPVRLAVKSTLGEVRIVTRTAAGWKVTPTSPMLPLYPQVIEQ